MFEAQIQLYEIIKHYSNCQTLKLTKNLNQFVGLDEIDAGLGDIPLERVDCHAQGVIHHQSGEQGDKEELHQ